MIISDRYFYQTHLDLSNFLRGLKIRNSNDRIANKESSWRQQILRMHFRDHSMQLFLFREDFPHLVGLSILFFCCISLSIDCSLPGPCLYQANLNPNSFQLISLYLSNHSIHRLIINYFRCFRDPILEKVFYNWKAWDFPCFVLYLIVLTV